MVRLALWLLQYSPSVRYYDRVGSDDYGGFAALAIVDLGLVYVMRFGRRGLEDVVQRAE
jgi:hypothetical protein